jgi:mono/diheme cytochrome c family protein
MKSTSIGIVAGIMGTLVLAVFNSSFAAEPHELSADTRQRVVLAHAQRHMMLAEMRGMLASVGGILQGLTTGDPAAAEKAARASGMAGSADMDPHIKGRLPQQFMDWAMRTHRGFDSLADRIKAGGNQTDIIRELATLTGNCVACHVAYRLDEAR